MLVVGMPGEIPVHAHEPAIEAFLLHDRFDAVDRGGVAGRRQPRPSHAMHSFELDVAIVQRIAEVSGRATRFAAADGVSLEHYHAQTRSDQVVRGREPGDAGANDAHIRLDRGVQRRVLQRWEFHPDRRRFRARQSLLEAAVEDRATGVPSYADLLQVDGDAAPTFFWQPPCAALTAQSNRRKLGHYRAPITCVGLTAHPAIHLHTAQPACGGPLSRM